MELERAIGVNDSNLTRPGPPKGSKLVIRKLTPLQFPASASVSAPIWAIQEEIFEIRDFTNASTFERLSHQISLATKHWAVALTSSEDARDEVLQMKDRFELGGFKCLWWRFREQR